MNKTAIKNFAVWARNKLIADISYRAGLIGITESGIASALPQSTGTTEFYDIGTAEPYSISGDAVRQRRRLVELIERKEKETDYKTAYKYIIEEVAYTWFNRLIAIRFMEVNDYLPSHIRVLSSESGKMEPDLVTSPFDSDLEFTKEEESLILNLKRENKMDELFRMLFIKQCNALNDILPALFETTKDYMELLLALSVIDRDGIIYHLINDIPEEDFDVEKGGQVEIIGWLYQYYIAEPKDALINARKKYKKEDIPFVTQLFTSDWIVRYMVENSLGRLWIDYNPNSEIKNTWEYFIDCGNTPDKNNNSKEFLKPEQIKVIDPCMGSGHILVYAFDVLMQIYESAGYSQRDAAKCILEKNIYGLDIDERAFQMAYFALMMKARKYNRRILRKDTIYHLYAFDEIHNISEKHLEYFGKCLSEYDRDKAIVQIKSLIYDFKDAKEYGSLIEIGEYDWDLLTEFVNDVNDVGQISFETIGIEETQTKLIKLIRIAKVLEQKYEIAVTNPPYMNSSYMPDKVKKMVTEKYFDYKSDLFAVFIYKLLLMCEDNGHIGMLTPYVWMFISSYEKLRQTINNMANITSLVQLEYNAFEAACVPVATFTMCKSRIRRLGEYIKLSDFKGVDNQAPKTLEAIKNPNCGYRYTANQDDFENITGAPIAYWASDAMFESFSQKKVGDYMVTREGMATADNNRFLRLWFEPNINNIGFGIENSEKALQSHKKWFPYNKGGEYRKWYGNNDYIVNWADDGREIRNNKDAKTGRIRSHNYNGEYAFKEGITWSALSSSDISLRYCNAGFLFDSKGAKGFPLLSKNSMGLIALLNSKVASSYLTILSPTIDFKVGDIIQIPIMNECLEDEMISELAAENIQLSKNEWDYFETSWDFVKHPLVRNKNLISEAYEEWKAECDRRFNKLKSNEEQLNERFISIYKLDNEIDYKVSDESISLRKADLVRDVKGLISYAVGCMFGRYSLDVEGIVYAGGCWNKENYSSFEPDKDNIITITDEEYFEDDIIVLFCKWIKTVYGSETLEENLDFIASALNNKGKTSREKIRNYFIQDFYKDHCDMYSVTGSGKRPIYWLFDSGKQNGFKALIYIHRYNRDTIGNLRVDYLHRMQRALESEINRMNDVIEHETNNREVAMATKRKEKLQKQLKECREYDEKIGHLALTRIELDLDDGVKCNYEKLQTAEDGKVYPVLSKIN